MNHLKDHMVANHDLEEGTYKCDLCGKSFTLEKYLLNHQKRIQFHERLNEINCGVCNLSFNSVVKLRKHQRDAHDLEDRKDKKCSYCQKCFTTDSILKTHVNAVHEKTIIYKCDICSKSFLYQYHVKLHKQKDHPNPHDVDNRKDKNKCSYCQK